MIDSMGKASDAEKERCRAGLEQSVYSNLGLKALLSRGKRRKGLECACPT